MLIYLKTLNRTTCRDTRLLALTAYCSALYIYPIYFVVKDPCPAWTTALRKFYGQATKSMRVDALAQVGDEGRG